MGVEATIQTEAPSAYQLVLAKENSHVGSHSSLSPLQGKVGTLESSNRQEPHTMPSLASMGTSDHPALEATVHSVHPVTCLGPVL